MAANPGVFKPVQTLEVIQATKTLVILLLDRSCNKSNHHILGQFIERSEHSQAYLSNLVGPFFQGLSRTPPTLYSSFFSGPS